MGLRFVDPPNGPPPAASYRHLAVVPSGSRLLVLAGQIGNLSEAPLLRGWRLNMNRLLSTSTPLLPRRGHPRGCGQNHRFPGGEAGETIRP